MNDSNESILKAASFVTEIFEKMNLDTEINNTK